MNGQVSVAIAGLGSRGFHTYAACAKEMPEKMKIVAGADIRPQRLAMLQETYGVDASACYASVEEMLEQDKLADVMFICTQDRQHVPHAIAALKKGYDILLEKPISPDLEECKAILAVAHETGRRVLVCHVLRYTPFYNTLKEVLDSKVIGDIVTMQHTENVVYWHQAHSFVRGNWRREDETSPMILAKCCHDMDLIVWLTGMHCHSISSYGGLHLFRPEMAPEGAAKRCVDGCLAKENCPYDAEKIYITDKATGVNNKHTGWPVDVVVDKPTEASVREALKTSPYGRCVYACDNDVVDHQVVNIEMEGGATVCLTMTAFTSRGGRDTRIMGTMGEIIADMSAKTITIMPFGKETQVIDVAKLASNFSGHGGGDVRMVEELMDLEMGGEPSVRTSSLDVSVESHLMAMAAEQSRKEGGRVILLKDI